MNYKNYTGKIEFDEKAEIFHGEVLDTKDVITFQGRDGKELKEAFKNSIDDYLEFCASREEEPDKPFSGKFEVQINPELHLAVYVKAQQNGTSINSVVEEAIAQLW